MAPSALAATETLDAWCLGRLGGGVSHCFGIPSGKQPHSYGKPPFLMGKSTISMVIFNSYVKLPEGIISTIN